MGGQGGNAHPGPPLIVTKPCKTLFEAGFQHGRAAASRIQQFLNSPEMVSARAFFSGGGPGAAACAELVEDNTAAFPGYAAEIGGIAEGAGLPVQDIWMVNLMCEMQALRGLPTGKRVEHCSDVMLRGNVPHHLWHGHNEDYTDDPLWHDLVYFVKYEAAPDAEFTPVLGFCYPGMIPGFAMTWGASGIVLTQNSLFPPSVKRRGLGCTFVARSAADAASLDEALLKLVRPNQALGMSVNVVDTSCPSLPRACNVEVHGVGSRVAVQWLEDSPGSIVTHFNVYSNLNPGNANNPRNSAARQARAQALLAAAPSAAGGAEDVKAVLADCKIASFPIFGPTTIASWLLDLDRREVVVWARTRPSFGPCLHRWPLDGFFAAFDLENLAPEKAAVGTTKISPPRPAWGHPASARMMHHDSAGTAAPADGGSGAAAAAAAAAAAGAGAGGASSSSSSSSSQGTLPLHRGIHKADLRLRREVSQVMAEARTAARNIDSTMQEANTLRKQLLQQLKVGELKEETAVQVFRHRLRTLLDVWPLDPPPGPAHPLAAGPSPIEEAARRSTKAHDLDVALRRELGALLKSKEGAAQCSAEVRAALVELRRSMVAQARRAEVSPSLVVANFKNQARVLMAQEGLEASSANNNISATNLKMMFGEPAAARSFLDV